MKDQASDNTDAERVPLNQFLGPRYWLVWIGLGLMRLAALCPYRLQVAVGKFIGSCAYRLAGKRRLVALKNLEVCFPELDDDKRQQLVKQHFHSVGIGLMEMSFAWWTSTKRLASLTEISGLEHLNAAAESDRGVILLAGHFTTIEIGGVLLSQHARFDAMYRKFENPLFEEVMRRKRSRWARKVIRRGDFRQMLRSLKDGHTVLYMPDQAYTRQNSLNVPFFGQDAPTSTGTERLVRSTGAHIVPFLPMRKDDGSGYLLQLFPAIDNFPGEDTLQNAIRINQVFEEQVKKAPAQYLWLHKRFKGMGVYDRG